jgi:hypothetical protein
MPGPQATRLGLQPFGSISNSAQTNGSGVKLYLDTPVLVKFILATI